MPHIGRAALEFMERVNPLNIDVLIRDGDIKHNLLAVGNNFLDNDIDFDVESDNELKCTTNPLNVHRHPANESLVKKN